MRKQAGYVAAHLACRHCTCADCATWPWKVRGRSTSMVLRVAVFTEPIAATSSSYRPGESFIYCLAPHSFNHSQHLWIERPHASDVHPKQPCRVSLFRYQTAAEASAYAIPAPVSPHAFLSSPGTPSSQQMSQHRRGIHI